MSDERFDLLIAAKEQPILEQLAAGEPPFSQRATAVLAVGAGETVEEAAARSGLTANQVTHWRGRFRNQRLAVFPAALVNAAATAAEEAPAAPDPVAPAEEERAESAPEAPKKSQKGKGEKKKGDKKDKKNESKKAKKGKGDKKDKKSDKKKSGKKSNKS